MNDLKPILLQTAQSTLLNPVERAEASDTLDALGYIPEDLYTYVKIPGDQNVPIFWIGKYPVTTLQYARFLISENFADKSLWSDLENIYPKMEQQSVLCNGGWKWLKNEIGDNEILTPRFWDSPIVGKIHPNIPVTGISWWEANAYAKWLLGHWEELDEGQQGLPKPSLIRLPVGNEWTLASILAKNWLDPSNHNVISQSNLAKFCNIRDGGIGRPTPAWVYPQGETLHKVMDMIGNTLEWQGDQVESLRWQSKRITSMHSFFCLRGISFSDSLLEAHLGPHDLPPLISRDEYIGFRLCLNF